MEIYALPRRALFFRKSLPGELLDAPIKTGKE